MTERSIKTWAFAGRLDRPQAGTRDDVEDRSALVRVVVLCRLLREALYETAIEIPNAQLTQELTVLEELAEAKLSQ